MTKAAEDALNEALETIRELSAYLIRVNQRYENGEVAELSDLASRLAQLEADGSPRVSQMNRFKTPREALI